jgi:hypothetical protein
LDDFELILSIELLIMKRRPIVAIQGGLGNQLFQWFFAHELLESSEFSIWAKFQTRNSSNTVRALGLYPLGLNCTHYKIIAESDSDIFRFNLILRGLDYLWNFKPLSGLLSFLGYFREDPRQGTRRHLDKPKRIFYANGYFQNWKFAENQKNQIRSELLPALSLIQAEVKQRFDLNSPYSVIHVRRGDYRSDQNPETMIGSLADEYFIQWVREHSPHRIILLAEDCEEVADLVSLIKPDLILDAKTTTAWETLAIMSYASAFLGSNSSLSWWGAWVASMNGATTYLPSNWDVLGRFNTSDFLFPACHSVKSIWEQTS